MTLPPATPPIYAALTADVVNSRKVDQFQLRRDKKLAEISKKHRSKGLILSPYAITAWDEFQVILAQPEYAPQVIFDLRRTFYPMQLWIAVGIGEVIEAHKTPVNRYAGGQAFERARIAADRLKASAAKYLSLTSFESGNELFDTIANAVYLLHDSLIGNTTAKQWAAINTLTSLGRQDKTAGKLGVDVSTISRTLKRGYYWQMLETIDAMARVIQQYFKPLA
jgi:SatD family protein